VADPPSADLAAQTARAELFERRGFEVWSNAWYAGHHLPGYSLLFPPLAAWLTPQVVGAVAAVTAAALFAALAHGAYGRRARLGALWFGAATAVDLLTGRLTFALGVAFGLAALLALAHRRRVAAPSLAVLTTAATPLAGLFLVIASAAVALARWRDGDWRQPAAVGAAALAAIGLLVLAFPVEGVEPFVTSTFLALPLLAAVALVVLPPRERALRIGFALYGLAAIVLFAIDNAVGGNAARLGALFAGPVLALALVGHRRPLALAALFVPLLVWQWSAPVRDLDDAIGDPSVERAFHQPLVEELASRMDGAPGRVHVLATRNRWEAVHVARTWPLARGWLRQAESDDFELFQDGNLTPRAHLEWLRERGVSFVAVPQGVELDYLARDEAALIATGQPYLREVWRNPDWRLYGLRRPGALVTASASSFEPASGARMASLGPESFTLVASEPSSYVARVRWTRYWEVVEGDACVQPVGEWTLVDVRSRSEVRVEASFALDAMAGARDGC
jgi:hypothetical protein